MNEDYKLMIGGKDGLYEIGFVNDLQLADEETPTFEIKIIYVNFEVFKKIFYPMLNNNWRKMHGIPMLKKNDIDI